MSRECSVEALKYKKWYEAPTWLKLKPDFWPDSDITSKKDEVNIEKKKTVLFSLTSLDEEFLYLSRVSQLKKTFIIIACMKRYIKNLKTNRREWKFGNLKNEEIKGAQVMVWKTVQKGCFQSENNERLHHLKPFDHLYGPKIFMRNDSERFQTICDLAIWLPSRTPEHLDLLNLSSTVVGF